MLLDSSLQYSHLFWLGLSLILVYSFLSNWFVPRLKAIMELRERNIQKVINEANLLSQKAAELEILHKRDLDALEEQLGQMRQANQDVIKQYFDDKALDLQNSISTKKQEVALQLEQMEKSFNKDRSIVIDRVKQSLIENLESSKYDI